MMAASTAPIGDWAYKDIVENSPVAIIYADEAGVVRLWNRGAEEIFGWKQEEALGRSMDFIIPEKYRVRHWEGYFRTMKTGTTKYGRTLLAVPALTKSGGTISIEFNVLLLKSASGATVGIAAFLMDVTARRQKDMELRKRIATLEAKS
jgi:PAS domain S-box-containing protein